MMDEEKRIVTFMGDAGKRIATITWKNIFDLFEVDCVEEFGDSRIVETKYFKDEAQAQTFAEHFTFGEKYGNV